MTTFDLNEEQIEHGLLILFIYYTVKFRQWSNGKSTPDIF